MFQQSHTDEAPAEPGTPTPSPLRGLVIAAPVALGLWFLVAELARFFV